MPVVAARAVGPPGRSPPLTVPLRSTPPSSSRGAAELAALRRRLLAAFSSALVVLFVGGLTAIVVLRLARAAERVELSSRVHAELDLLLRHLRQAEAAQRDFVISGDSAYLAPFREAMAEFARDSARVYALVGDDPLRRPVVDTLAALAARRLGELERTVAMRGADGFQRAAALVRADSAVALTVALRRLLDRLTAAERERLELRAQERRVLVETTLLVVVVGSLASGVISLLTYRSIDRLVASRERAWTHTAEALADARAAGERLRLLADAGTAVSASLELDEVLQTVCALPVPRLATWSLVVAVEADGSRRAVAAAAESPRKEALVRDIARHLATTELPAGSLLRRVLEEERPQQLAPVTAASLGAVARDGPFGEAVAELQPTSVVAVPLTGGTRLHGVLLMGSDGNAPPLGQSDLALAVELARRAEQAVSNAELVAAEREASRVKSDFLAAMSHELRTPLNAIIGYTQLMLEGISGELAPLQRTQLQRIDVASRHLLGLVDELLTFARVQSGQEVVERQRIDVVHVAMDALALVTTDATAKGLRLVTDVPDAPCEAWTDPGRLRQVVANLLTNAVKFTDHGEVALRVRCDAGSVSIQVRDTGIGIAPEHHERIFDAFWQAERTRSRRAPGTGLGLSVARRLARLLGGDVTVESALGRGSTFTVTLPRGEGGGDVTA